MAEQFILDGNPPITVHVRRSAQARRLSLRVSRVDGRVTMTLPRRVPVRDAQAFARDRADWLAGHLADQEPVQRAVIGTKIPVLGVLHRIEGAAVRSPRIEGGQLLVPLGDTDRTPVRVAAFLKSQARDALTAASDMYAAKIERSYTRMTLRDTRSRWGSCSSQGALMYSWRLIMAPPDVLSYVAAHEVAHLAEMNHSPAFWDIVERLFPNHIVQKRWLRDEGTSLQRWQFA